MRLAASLFLFALLTSPHTVRAGNLTFEKANQLYHNKAYGRALDLYNQLIDNGFQSPELYYNAGNAAFKLDKTGYAIWAYKKSLRIENRKNVRDNYLLAKEKVQKPISRQKDIFFIRWWRAIYSALTLNQWAIAAVLLFFASMSSLLFRKWKRLNPIVLNPIKLLLLLSAICFLFMGVNRFQEATNCEAVVIRDTVFSTEAEMKNRKPIVQGIELLIRERKSKGNGQLFKVRLPNAQEVWMNAIDIKLID